ncbi:2-hydroxychromene-2-carboxylate isomerase [Paraburkholderia hospita]|uniref:2-hydroxychromene-2-carboxylate isomerase n=1 Tax=Paraburkholderia hospita TaxID=169430 RepID=UPI000DEF3996|nr:2-hydroxychromene-2-carboxylate isomerase [Paraburkholderia hospita]AXF05900.1 2-hydroxychromene-2-carboxylate isomerase [Paraburkholderia hospita]
MKRIDYYYWLNSDWAYLGNDRLEEIAARHRAELNYLPVDLPYVYAHTGGVLLSQRSVERQAYRETELVRWCKKLGIHVNPTPRFMCPNGDLASCVVIAAKFAGLKLATLSQAILHAEWVEEQDISCETTLSRVIDSVGYDSASLLRDAGTSDVAAEYRSYTKQAIAAGVFGSPSYVFNGEVFWGQDRLEFLDAALAEQ